MLGMSMIQAQVKIQVKPDGPPGLDKKDPQIICNENGVCEYGEYVNDLPHELQPCIDCKPKDYGNLVINQDTDVPGVQILSYWPENHKLFQFKFEDGEYKDTWTSVSSEDASFTGGNPYIGDPDQDGDKEIVVIKNYFLYEESTGRGRNKIITKYYEQVASIFENGSDGFPTYVTPHFGKSEGSAFRFIMADANNDGIEDELILSKSCNDDSYIHGGSYIQIFRYNATHNDFEELWTSPSYDSAGLTSVADADGDGDNEIVLRSFWGGYAIIIDYLGEDQYGVDTWGDAKFSEAIPDCRLDDALAAEADNVGTPDMPDPEIIGGGNTGELAVWKLIDGEYKMVFLSESMSSTFGDGYIGDIEVGDIDDDDQKEVMFSYYLFGGAGTIIYVCELVLEDLLDPYSYYLYIESATVLDRPGPAFAIGDIDGDGKDEIVHNGRGGTIYDYDNDNECLNKLYYSYFLANPVVK